MIKPLKWGFKMDMNLKCSTWGKNFVIILIGIEILIGLSPIFETGSQNSKNWTEDLNPGKLAIVEGNTLLPKANPLNPEPQVARKIRVVVTAYSSTPEQTDDSPYITAAGTWVREGIIANNLLPFGTKVRLPEIYGDKIFVVEDRMHPRKGYYLVDVWFPSYWQAKEFGAKRTFIEVLES